MAGIRSIGGGKLCINRRELNAMQDARKRFELRKAPKVVDVARPTKLDMR